MIETARLILRPHIPDDFAASYAMWADPDVVRFLGGISATREDMWGRLLRYAGHWALFGYGLFAVFEKAGGAFIGETGIATFRRGLGERFDPFPEAAWVLARAAQGKGYAAEAAMAAHAWFDARGHGDRTVCIIDPANTASIRLAGKLGYVAFGEAAYRKARVRMFERRGCSRPIGA